MVICLHPAFELRYELKIRIYLGFSYLNKFSDSGSLPVSSINGRVWFAFRSLSWIYTNSRGASENV